MNEAGSLGPLLDEIAALPAGVVEHTVVADAGSTDGTPDVARSHGATVITQSRSGYGAACYEGFLAARSAGATHVLFLDGDGSDPPDAIPALLTPLLAGHADPVLAIRQSLPGAPSPLPWHARFGNALVCKILQLRTGRRIHDLPSMKALSVETLDALNMTQMGFGWTTELIAKSLRHNLRLHEHPIHTRPRTAGHSKVSGNPLNSARAAYALLCTAIQATG